MIKDLQTFKIESTLLKLSTAHLMASLLVRCPKCPSNIKDLYSDVYNTINSWWSKLLEAPKYIVEDKVILPEEEI